jgi:hypothetical protein
MRAVLLALILILVTADASFAKAQVEKVVIRGPGISGKVSLTDRSLLRALAMGGLEDVGRNVESAPKVGDGYELTRYFSDRLPGDVPVDRVHYFPTSGRGPGYVFHHSTTGSARANWYDGRWFVATPSGDRAMRRVLARYVVRPKPSAATAAVSWPFVALGAIALAAGLGFLVLRRRAWLRLSAP